MSGLDGPLPGSAQLVATEFPLDGFGYVAEEYVLSGMARSFRRTGEPDRPWAAEPDGRAPYRTRVVIYRPADEASGLVVEWLNVSAGRDAAPGWLIAHRHLIRERLAWAGVSVQRAGVDGGGAILGRTALGLRQADPARYGRLTHPGDAFGYDMFTQAGRALRGLLGAEWLLAYGKSQSARHLVTYLNAVEPLDPGSEVYDGYLVHARPDWAAPLDGGAPDRSKPIRIRTDGQAPVLVLQTETDVLGERLHARGARQPDGDRVRTWEIAGASHVDRYSMGAAVHDDGRLPIEDLATLLSPATEFLGVSFDLPVNPGLPHHYVSQAAVAALDRWVREGVAPATASPLAADRDEYGIARGGVRTPWVEVPVAALSGLGQPGDGWDSLFGSAVQLPPETIAALYPGGIDDYMARFTVATDEAIDAGFLLDADRAEILAVAQTRAGSCIPK